MFCGVGQRLQQMESQVVSSGGRNKKFNADGVSLASRPRRSCKLHYRVVVLLSEAFDKLVAKIITVLGREKPAYMYYARPVSQR